MIEYHFYERRTVVGGELCVEPEECYCCGSEAPLHLFERTTIARPEIHPTSWLLCELCACTFTSTFTDYANQHSADLREATKVTVYCANTVLKQLGKFQEQQLAKPKPVPEGLI